MDQFNQNQNDIENVIKSKSAKDCIDGLPPLSMGGAFIPAQLSEVLDNKIKPFSGMTEIHAQYYAIVSGLASFDYNKLNEQNYWYLWKLLLYIEYHQYLKDMQKYSLFNQRLERSQKRPDEFLVAVPGLLEDRPSLKEFDQIDLMQANGKNHCVGIVTHVGQDYVSVDVPLAFRNTYKQDQIFNIVFRIDDWTAKCWNYILDTVDKENITSMLFPTSQSSSYVIGDKKKIEWINKNIETNPEQQQAVLNILNKTSHTAPYILFGPPGTGKTSTLVETICQIMRKNSSTKILICTPSNAAADEIAERLLKNLGFVEDDFMYRMYSSSRSSDDVKQELKSFSNFADRKTVFVNKEVFMTKKIVITTLATCIRLHGYKLRENYFSYLFIDEAGQATEIDTLIPMVLMCGKDSTNSSKFSGQVVIAGDPKQLGPTVQSRVAEPLLGKSMLERLMGWSLYAKQNNKYNPRYVTKLVQNYRCHEAILSVPNDLFYEGELVAMGGEHTTRAVNWPMLPRNNFPVIFHAIKGKEGRKKYSPSVYNDNEIGQVIYYVKKLLHKKLGSKIVMPEDIGIVTPYKLQRSIMHKALEYHNLNNISVGTVEVFQGQEKDIIIISTVRSVIYKTEENTFHIGFLSNPKRFNVALTRAKSLLIVIGHPDILQQDYCWRAFVKYCVKNNACNGEYFTLDQSLDNLDIRQITERKLSKELMKNGRKKIVEDDEILKDQEIDFKDLPRRRRVPSGPLSFNERYSSNKIQEILSSFDNGYHRQLQVDNFDAFSDGSDASEGSVEEDEEINDPEEQFDENSRMAKEFFASYLKKLTIEEEKYEEEMKLKIKMKELEISD
ncbi:GSCOCG00003526001-RA-CDS [Cotesia congregata]|uniref:RNA helicase n=1 Tax=Cotesia congregata TaxID=51543 RepID=A0A8J2H627_COTCN|nr:GSCOCG00003526001-RA-CDS [Cotesia congregata]CAG5077606.1 Similar to mov10b.1: Putative helicase mov-10-B.1 (Danio rerio) [Cotesia congregata]